MLYRMPNRGERRSFGLESADSNMVAASEQRSSEDGGDNLPKRKAPVAQGSKPTRSAKSTGHSVILSEDQMQLIAKALADPRRFEILSRLVARPVTCPARTCASATHLGRDALISP